MSKIVYDALLTRALAQELDRRLAGARARALRFEADARRIFLATGPTTLAWRLHPEEGALALTGLRVDGNASLPAEARIAAVRAPLDERTIELELQSAGESWGSLFFELATNARNAVLTATDGRILAVLNERRGAARRLVAGEAYVRPPPPGRSGTDVAPSSAEWLTLLGGIGDMAELRSRLLRTIAWTSPLNAEYVLGGVGARSARGSVGQAEAAIAVEAARERWLELAGPVWVTADETAPAWQPCVIGDAQPYVHPLGSAVTPHPSILAAIESAAGAVIPEAAEERRDRALLQLESRLRRVLRRAEQLEAELAGAGRDAVALRTKADLLLAQLHRVERGASVIELEDFEGGTITLELDPARDAAANANDLYERARRRDRAATRLPVMIARAREEAERLEATVADVAAGRVAPDAWLPAEGGRPDGRSGRRPPDVRALPYRTFVTSGGLEVRVGRSGRANDELTLHHARSSDIWLHARDTGGAHVVLRWSSPDTNPPHTDLVEAATLAALNSRARTSGVVPVDWTRRKYVRKPRRSPPGRVTIERAKTLFVEPSEAIAERMRQDPD